MTIPAETQKFWDDLNKVLKTVNSSDPLAKVNAATEYLNSKGYYTTSSLYAGLSVVAQKSLKTRVGI